MPVPGRVCVETAAQIARRFVKNRMCVRQQKAGLPQIQPMFNSKASP
jgi:hypothetical protein